MKDYALYYSADFQCPMTGVPVQLVWNPETGDITAQICSLWDLWSEHMSVVEQVVLEQETKEWCKGFKVYATDFDKANEIAEEYDCWF